MRYGPLRSFLTLTAFFALLINPIVAGVSQSQPPSRYSQFGFTIYGERRTGYEIPPVQILRLRGGKHDPDEKLKIGVFLLQNKTEKNIKAVKFKTFIFDRKDLNEVLETVHTSLTALDIPALTRRECDILILYADDIPLLAYKAGEEYRLEVAVAQVQYDDGTIWEAKKLPGKLDLSKMR